MQQDVFEMILDTAKKDQDSFVHATASDTPPTEWHEQHEEGQLAVDVADTGPDLVIVSTMAGAASDRIEVYIHNDLLTIRGVRQSPLAAETDIRYHVEECFWGTFSRTIVLPAHVKGDLARAEYRGGVLVVRIPKRDGSAQVPVVVVDE